VIEVAQWSKEVFARNLKRYMDLHDKNQKDMAEVVGVSTATFSDYINAKKYPRIDKIELLADYFGVNKSDLIEEMPTDHNVRLARMEKNVVRVPLLGKIPAGMPMEAIEDEYTVEINGVEYSHVSTTGGRCNIYETVHVLVPQGNFSNMFILKGGGSSSSGSTTPSDVTTETENIDFTNTF
jgi:transcriptional regulator with XRE-family HTH domain